MQRPSLLLLVPIFLLLASCSGGGGSVGSTSGGASASGADGTSDVSCAKIEPSDRDVAVESVEGEPPPLSGGTLSPGRYVLTTLRTFGKAPEGGLGSSFSGFSSAVVVGAGSSLAIVSSSQSRTQHMSGKYSTSGGRLTLSMVCADPPAANSSDDSSIDYEASPTQIVWRGMIEGSTAGSAAALDMVYVKE